MDNSLRHSSTLYNHLPFRHMPTAWVCQDCYYIRITKHVSNLNLKFALIYLYTHTFTQLILSSVLTVIFLSSDRVHRASSLCPWSGAMVHQCACVLMCVCMRSCVSLCILCSVNAAECVAGQRAVTVSHHPLDIANRHSAVFLFLFFYEPRHRRLSTAPELSRGLQNTKKNAPFRAEHCGRKHVILTVIWVGTCSWNLHYFFSAV